MKPKLIVIGDEEFEVPEGTTREQFIGYLAREGITPSAADLATAFPTPGGRDTPTPDAAGLFGQGGAGDVGLRFAKGAGSEINPRGIGGFAQAFDEEQRRTPGMPYEAALGRTLVKGLAAPLKGMPDAARRVMGGDVRGGLDAAARSLPVVGPSYANVSDRVSQGDYAGAAGAGLMGAATTLLPAARAAGVAKAPSVTGGLARAAVAVPRELGGVPMAAGVLDTSRDAARAVLAEGGLRTTIPGGIRRLGRRAAEATDTAAASAPAKARIGPVRPGPAVKTTMAGQRGTTPEAKALMRQTLDEEMNAATMIDPKASDAIRQAEQMRTRTASRGVAPVLGAPGPVAQIPRDIATDLRAQARPFLPSYGQRSLDVVDRVAGPHDTLAAARHLAPSNTPAGLGGAGGGTRGMIAHGLATGAAPVSQALYGGLTEQAIQQMLRAAILARMSGGNDDEPPEF